jgi:hypothetical protein
MTCSCVTGSSESANSSGEALIGVYAQFNIPQMGKIRFAFLDLVPQKYHTPVETLLIY